MKKRAFSYALWSCFVLISPSVPVKASPPPLAKWLKAYVMASFIESACSISLYNGLDSLFSTFTDLDTASQRAFMVAIPLVSYAHMRAGSYLADRCYVLINNERLSATYAISLCEKLKEYLHYAIILSIAHNELCSHLNGINGIGINPVSSSYGQIKKIISDLNSICPQNSDTLVCTHLASILERCQKGEQIGCHDLMGENINPKILSELYNLLSLLNTCESNDSDIREKAVETVKTTIHTWGSIVQAFSKRSIKLNSRMRCLLAFEEWAKRWFPLGL